MSSFDAAAGDPGRIDHPAPGPAEIRADLRLVADMIAPRSRVLDVGCGDGMLLHHLVSRKGVDGRGIEISMDGVHQCVSRGLSVIQGNAETDLADYPERAFDYIVLSQTLQAMHRPREILAHLVRIGGRAIVSFPNFGYWRVRMALLWSGRMPVTQRLGYEWHETPNIHLCTIRDFEILCRDLDIRIERSVILDRRGNPTPLTASPRWANLFGEQGIFLLRAG